MGPAVARHGTPGNAAYVAATPGTLETTSEAVAWWQNHLANPHGMRQRVQRKRQRRWQLRLLLHHYCA
jgi:hypothetical protein